MADQIYFEDLNEGDSIPELKKNPSTQQLVQWAAGSGDFYQIHYDTAFAQNTGLQGIIVHGALKHAFLGDLLHRMAGPEGRVKRVTCSYRGMDVPAEEYTLRGPIMEVEIWGENEKGQKTTPGTGTVTLPSRA
jgi:acyl dehydratase